MANLTVGGFRDWLLSDLATSEALAGTLLSDIGKGIR